MKIRLLLIALIILVNACTETVETKNKQKETTTTTEEFTANQKTSKHINIPGTRLFIVPPKGFKVSTATTGLEKDDMVIQIFDLIGGNFYTNTNTFSKEALEKGGVKVYQYRELKVNGFPAKYAMIEGEGNLKGINLVFGDTTFSTMVMAMFPASNNEIEAELKKSLETIYYDKSHEVNSLATARFTLDENVSKFKFAKSGANIMMYTIDGIDKPSYENESIVMVSTLPIDGNMTLRSTAESLIDGLKEKGLVVSEIKNKAAKTVDGVSMYQIDVHGSLKGEKIIMHMLVAVDYEKVVILQGLIKSDFKEHLKEVKKLASTLKLITNN